MTTAPTPTDSNKKILQALHISVLVTALGLIAYITYDTLRNISFVASETYAHIQLWVCLFFEVEIFAEYFLSENRSKFLLRNLFSIIICFPYIYLIHHFNIPVRGEWEYLLRLVPLIRAGFVIAITWDMMSRNWISSLFGAYIIMLVTTLYFLSLMFYVEEHSVNPQVYNYWQSLWYSIMQMTTCGSNINPVTTAGKIIGIVLSAEGLILFPIFTVYITRAFAKNK